MRAAERDARASGMRVGLYANAFPYANAADPVTDLPAARALVKARAVRFLVDYLDGGGRPEVLHLVFWHKVPDLTGPETTAMTAMNVFREQVRELLPLSGDWDGDGIDTVGVFDPSGGTWSRRNRNSAGSADVSFTFGSAGGGYLPLSGDWNGDGTDTIGPYQSSSRTLPPRGRSPCGTTSHRRPRRAAHAAGTNWEHALPARGSMALVTFSAVCEPIKACLERGRQTAPAPRRRPTRR
jgi:hypothetical protein